MAVFFYAAYKGGATCCGRMHHTPETAADCRARVMKRVRRTSPTAYGMELIARENGIDRPLTEHEYHRALERDGN